MKLSKRFIFAGCLILNTFLTILAINLTTSQAQAQLLKSVKDGLESQEKSVKALDQKLQNLESSYKKLDRALNKELTFREGLKFVLAFEGGLTDDDGDPGGLTNLGITHTEYDQYRISKGLQPRSVAKISLKEASDIYRNTYWVKSGCGDLTRRVALSCFDWQVNSGRGVTTLQQTLGGIAVDGSIGSETLNELDSWLSKPGNENKLLHNYFEKRESAYRQWGVGIQSKFLQGWLRRSETLKDYLKVS